MTRWDLGVVVAIALSGCSLASPLGAPIAATPIPALRERAQVWCDSPDLRVPLVRDEATGDLVGAVTLAGRAYGVRVERAPGRPPRLLADRLGDGSFDAVLVGTSLPSPSIEGDVAFVLPGPREYRVFLDFFEGGRGPLLRASPGQWEFGEVDLGGRRFRYAVRDRDGDGSFADLEQVDLLFDRDEDGRFDGGGGGEGFKADSRFNLGTGTFAVKAVSEDGKSVEFASSLIPTAASPFLGQGDEAPAISGRDLDGEPVALADFRGKNVLLVFWGSWCGPCVGELRDIAKGWRRFRKKFDGEVLGVCMDADAARPKKLVAELNVPFRSVLAGDAWNAPAAKAYGIRQVPMAVLVGPDGRIVERRVMADRYLREE